MKHALALTLSLALVGCSTSDETGTSGTSSSSTGGDLPGTPIPPDDQRMGDAQKGYTALVNEGYVSCGVPYTAYKVAFGPAPKSDQLPGRKPESATLPYNMTRFTTSDGIDVVSANCLGCHAGHVKGQLIVGLGDSQGDFTQNNEGANLDLAQNLLTDPKEKAELTKFADRVKALGPNIRTAVAGVNPADNIAAVLFAHRDRKTLAWNDTPELPIPPEVVPVDVPPWWRMKKKNAMFYVAGGRGDHARIEMTASTLCTDSVDEAKHIDSYFPDIAAFISSIEPPKYPGPIDSALAAKGKPVFESTCSRCHGTYGDGGTYPNLLIPIETIGTDNTMVSASAEFSGPFTKWFNESFYGEIARLEQNPGYIAPPLDGIWATAPFLHNGSVPTIGALLDSSKRPKYWARKVDSNTGVYDDNDYDDANVGWNFNVVDHGQAAEKNDFNKRHLYDTTLPGYSNSGHLFGDPLSEDDRKAVIEYLKTL